MYEQQIETDLIFFIPGVNVTPGWGGKDEAWETPMA